MVYQGFLENKTRRLTVLLILMLLYGVTSVVFFALMVTAFNVTGVGALTIPFAFCLVIVFEIIRYYFYRSFFLQQMARLAAWKNPLDGGIHE